MPDNVVVSNAGPGDYTVATDEVQVAGSQPLGQVGWAKLVDGTPGGTDAIPGSTANGLRVDVSRVQGTVAVSAAQLPAALVAGRLSVDASGVPVPVTDNGGSLTVDGTVSISGPVTVSGVTLTSEKAEDAAAANGDVGIVHLGVRNDAAAARIGSDGDYGVPALDSAGRVGIADLGGSITVDGTVGVSGSVAVTGTFWQATQPVSAASLPLPAGASQEHTTAASPNSARLTDGASFYDAAKTGQLPAALVSGRLDVNVGAALPAGTNNIGDVDVLTLPSGYAKTADLDTGAGTDTVVLHGIALPKSGGAVAGGTSTDPVRTDPTGTTTQPVSGTVTANAGTGPFPVSDNGGSLTVDGTVAVSAVTPGTGATALGKAEDAAHTTGDVGVLGLAVRRDANTTLVDTDGDYAPLQVDANGALKVTGGGGGTQYIEDAASAGGETGTVLLGVRRDANTTPVSADGDFHTALFDASGGLKVSIIAGAGSGGTAIADDAAFTVATTQVTPAGYLADEVTPDSVDEGDVGIGRMSLNRNQYVQLRDLSAERSAAVTAANALKTDGSGVTQPVSGTVTANAGTGPFPVSDNAGSLTVDAPVGTPVAARLSDGTAFLTTTGGRLSVDASGVAVPITDNAGSLTVDNAGTFAVQDSQVLTDNGAFVDGTSKLFTGGFIFDEVAGTALTENDVAAARVNANRAQVGVIEDGATRARYATVSAANALKVDGSAVTQPISAAALPLPTGAAAEHTTAASPHSARLTDGAAFYDAAKTGQLPTALVGGRLDVNVGAALPAGTNNIGDVDVLTMPVVQVGDNAGSLTVDGTVTAVASGDHTVVGKAAHDAAVSGNPVLIAGRAKDGAAPTSVSADDDVVYPWLRRSGAQVIDNIVNVDDLSAAPNVNTDIAAVGTGPGFDIKLNPANLGTAANSAITNTVDGADIMQYAIGTTTTGTFTFEVSADDSTWLPAEVTDEPTSVAVTGTNITPTANKVYRVFVQGWRQVRIRTVTTLGATVAVKTAAHSGAQHILPAPHAFPYALTSKTAQYTTTQTGTALWTPASGKRLVITSYQIQAGGTTAGTVQLWFEAADADTTYTRGTDVAIFDGEFVPSATSKPGVVQSGLWMGPSANMDLRVTDSAAISPLTITVWGYEI